MLLINRLIPIVGTIVIWISMESIVLAPNHWYLFAILLVVVITILTLRIFAWQYHKKEFWGFLSSILLLITSSIFFLFFIDGSIARLSFIVATSILGGFYLNNIFLYLHRPKSYQAYALQNVSGYLNLISLFLFSSSLFSTIVFLNVPVYLLIVLFFIVTYALIAQSFWVNSIDIDKSKIFLLVMAFLMTELFWSAHYLPTSFFVNGLVLTLIFYMIQQLGLNYFSGKDEPATIKRTLLIGSSMIVLLLVFAQWT
ncbi:MAG: hypothetical protein ABIB97_00705 [Patescibacteria group bacterium]